MTGWQAVVSLLINDDEFGHSVLSEAEQQRKTKCCEPEAYEQILVGSNRFTQFYGQQAAHNAGEDGEHSKTQLPIMPSIFTILLKIKPEIFMFHVICRDA